MILTECQISGKRPEIFRWCSELSILCAASEISGVSQSHNAAEQENEMCVIEKRRQVAPLQKVSLLTPFESGPYTPRIYCRSILS